MPSTSWAVYGRGRKSLLNGDVDLDQSLLKMALMASTYVADLAQELFSEISANELVAPGYIAGGSLLTNKLVSLRSGTSYKFSADPVSWLASGGAWVVKHAVIYDSTTGILICYCQLETSGTAEITVPDTTALVISPHADGFFYIP